MKAADIIHDYETSSNPTGPDGDPKDGCFLVAIIVFICVAIGSVITHGIN